jgi:prepilin-type N-terminal cleavage/methylation domain-containing protein
MSSADSGAAGRLRAATGGFTLLEVLAAAVIMAAAYAVLTASNIQGTILEGDADRRLHASLLADRVLADLEGQVAAGSVPELGRTEQEEDRFTVQVDVSPLELPLESWLPEPDDRPAPVARGLSLLAPSGRGESPALRQVQVTIAWFDGIAEREVQRTTFVLDPVASALMLQQAGVSSDDGLGATP